MKIGDLARLSGLTAHTIRYYEKIGLLPYADRDASHQRDYDRSILGWVEFLNHLKATSMPIAKMLEYAQLRYQGNETIPQRRHLLQNHRQKVEAHIKDLVEKLDLLDRKVAAYQQIEQEMAASPTTIDSKTIDWEARFRKLAKS